MGTENKNKSGSKKDRLAAKLRENLRKRKDQAKARGLEAGRGGQGAFRAFKPSGNRDE